MQRDKSWKFYEEASVTESQTSRVTIQHYWGNLRPLCCTTAYRHRCLLSWKAKTKTYHVSSYRKIPRDILKIIIYF